MCDNESMGDLLKFAEDAVKSAEGSPVAAIFWTMAAGLLGLYLLVLLKGRAPVAGAAGASATDTAQDVTTLQAPLFELIREIMKPVVEMSHSTNKVAVAVEDNTNVMQGYMKTLSRDVHNEGVETRAALHTDVGALVQVVAANNELLAELLKAWKQGQTIEIKPPPPKQKAGRAKKESNKVEAMQTASVE
jgi:hypothetical protein